MARKKEESEEGESLGSDLEQMVAMLEKAEVDYDKTEYDDDGDHETRLLINDEALFRFDEDGNLLSVDVVS